MDGDSIILFAVAPLALGRINTALLLQQAGLLDGLQFHADDFESGYSAIKTTQTHTPAPRNLHGLTRAGHFAAGF